MANFYIVKNFSKLFNDTYSQVHDLKYYSAAMAEFYAKRENEIAEAMSLSGSYDDTSYVSVIDQKDRVIYVPLSDLTNSQEDVLSEITCYLNVSKTKLVKYSVAEILALLTDQYSRAVSLRSLFDYISGLGNNEKFNGSKVLDIIKLKIDTSFVPADVKSRLAAYNDHSALDVMVNTITTSAPVPTGTIFDFSEYEDNYLDIVEGAVGSIISDLTYGLQEIFDALNVFENLGETLLEAIKQLGENIISKVAYPLFVDYEINADNDPYFDVPFQTFTWPSMAIFDQWINQALHEFADPSSVYSSRTDATALIPNQNSGRSSELGILPAYSIRITNQQATAARAHIMQSLADTGYVEMLVCGVIIRIVRYDGKVWCGFYATYYWQDGIVTYSSSSSDAPALIPDVPEGNSINISNNVGIITSVEKPNNQAIMKSIWYRNETFKALYSAPIWYKGHLLPPLTAADSLYSKFVGLEPSDYSINSVINALPSNKAIELTGSLRDRYTPGVMAGEGRMVCQMLLAFGTVLITPNIDWDSIFKGLSYTMTDDSNNTYYLSTVKSYSYFDKDHNIVNEEIPIKTIYYPFYTTNCRPAVVHGQSNAEREKELKSYIYSLVAVAAAISLTIGATKLRKTLKTKSLAANAALQQKLLSADLTDKSQVAELYKANRSAKIWNTIASVTGSNTMTESVDSLIKGRISDDAQVIIDLISGR